MLSSSHTRLVLTAYGLKTSPPTPPLPQAPDKQKPQIQPQERERAIKGEVIPCSISWFVAWNIAVRAEASLCSAEMLPSPGQDADGEQL